MELLKTPLTWKQVMVDGTGRCRRHDTSTGCNARLALVGAGQNRKLWVAITLGICRKCDHSGDKSRPDRGRVSSKRQGQQVVAITPFVGSPLLDLTYAGADATRDESRAPPGSRAPPPAHLISKHARQGRQIREARVVVACTRQVLCHRRIAESYKPWNYTRNGYHATNVGSCMRLGLKTVVCEH